MRVLPAEGFTDSSRQEAVPQIDGAVIPIADGFCEPTCRERAPARFGMFAEECLLPPARLRELCQSV
jgi:hypothetical protein